MDTLRWKHPFAALISGPSGAGKTEFVKKFLENLGSMCDTKFSKIIFYYGEWQPAYRQLAATQPSDRIDFREGVPQSTDFAADAGPQLVIIDDLMDEAGKSVAQIFTKTSHHRDLSVFFLTQNLFHRGQREISLNSNYVVVFKNPRDRAQIQHFSRQICPENPRYVQEAYENATSPPFGYLLFDLKQDTPENCRLRTDIFPAQDGHRTVVYVPIKGIKSATKGLNVPVLRA